MPQRDEDMRKRHEKREAMRKKQAAESRRLKLTLVLAALVLAVCAGALVNLTRTRAGTEEEEPRVAATEAPKETKASRLVQQDPITTIHIKAAGDLNVTNSVIKAGLSASGYDYSRAFKDVGAILADADLTVMNFEGNLYGEPYGTDTTSAPIELMKGLRNCGVDLLQMANSCAVNNGLNGLTATLNAIRSVGIEPVGAFASQEEMKNAKGYTIAEVNGIKIAFVAFTKGLGGRGLPSGSEGQVNLLYQDYATEYKKVDWDGIEAILKNVEAEKPDVTIALLHWGSEYNDDISTTQKNIVTRMQKKGVDVILGTHPHTLQAIDYNAAKGTLVAYSLGDFFGDAERGGTNYSIILDLEITKDNSSGTTKVTGYSYTPIYTVKESECDGYQRVVRIEKAMEAYNGNFLDKVTQSAYESMDYALTRIEQRLQMEEE